MICELLQENDIESYEDYVIDQNDIKFKIEGTTIEIVSPDTDERLFYRLKFYSISICVEFFMIMTVFPTSIRVSNIHWPQKNNYDVINGYPVKVKIDGPYTIIKDDFSRYHSCDDMKEVIAYLKRV